MQTLLRDDHAKALARFREDQELVSRLCLKIVDKKTAQIVPFVFKRAQQVVEEERQKQLEETGSVRMLILKGRQLGISTTVGGICYIGCKLHTGRKAKILADKLERSGGLFGIYERFEREAPAIISRPTLAAERKKELAWVGDSSLLVGTANDPEAGRSETLWYVHCSEFAFWQYPTEVLKGLLQAVPPNLGEVYIESTANGIGNTFNSMWEAAEAKESGWVAVFLPWWIDDDYRVEVSGDERRDLESSQDPWERMALDTGFYWRGRSHRLVPEQLAFRRRKIADDFDGDERAWRQEYPATPEEAFIASGGAFFDQDRLSELFSATRRTSVDRRSLVSGRLSKAEKGSLRIYEWPDDKAHYVIGADTAEGKQVRAQGDDDEKGGRDYSSADVVKVAQWVQGPDGKDRLETCREQVASYHGRMGPESFAEGLYALGLLYSCRGEGQRDNREPALVVVERNHSSGQTVLRWLRDHDYPRIFRQRPKNVVGEKRPTISFGFLTDQGSRRMILDTLANHVRNGVSGVVSAETVREFRTFVLNDLGKPEAQEGCHDDRVISYALALEGERWHSHASPSTHVEPTVRMTPTGV